MNYKPLTMHDCLMTMMDVMQKWQESDEADKDDLINPFAPMIIQTNKGYFYVLSIGGDDEFQGIIIESTFSMRQAKRGRHEKKY